MQLSISHVAQNQKTRIPQSTSLALESSHYMFYCILQSREQVETSLEVKLEKVPNGFNLVERMLGEGVSAFV